MISYCRCPTEKLRECRRKKVGQRYFDLSSDLGSPKPPSGLGFAKYSEVNRLSPSSFSVLENPSSRDPVLRKEAGQTE